MKKIGILLLLISCVSFYSYAQSMNYIPTKSVNILPNGWHKFELHSVVYDVEVTDHVLVKGNIKWFDGSTYSGSLGAKGISGRGTYTWPNGERYEGSARNNERHGKGTMYWKDGTKFNGKWKRNKQHGKGKLFDANGTITQSGIWEEGKLIKEKK